MGVARWPGPLGLPSALVVAALLIAALVPASTAAGPPPRPTASPCASPSPLSAGVADMLRQPQARVSDDALLTSRGEFVGQRVTVERSAAEPVVIGLPAEGFVSGAQGAAVVYGWHSPQQGSEIRLVDAATGCDLRLARPTEVVRRAVLAPDGAWLYVHRVTQSERRDQGVVRVDLASGEQVQVVEPLPESDLFGPTFATSLSWSQAEDELAVQSCGADRCRTRVLDARTGAVQTYAEADHGSLIGFDRSTLVVYDACHWAPCAVLAIDRATGAVAAIVAEAFDARLTADADDTLLLTVDTPAGQLEVRP